MMTSNKSPTLGCIADDFTGATDLAINLVQGGFRVVQLLGIPAETSDAVASTIESELADFDAIVVALKTRSVPVDQAKSESVEAMRFLRRLGIERFYFKYCSTFDSTADGNIGPVAEALGQEVTADCIAYCPAFPRAGRTVYQGHLFVGDRLLSESGMEKHPLNPMVDSDLVRFLGQQVTEPVGLIDFKHLQSAETIGRRKAGLVGEGVRHLIVDTCSDEQLEVIAQGLAGETLLTGGSGLARFLPEVYRARKMTDSIAATPQLPRVEGKNLILAGSCSSATLSQVNYMASRCPTERINVVQALGNHHGEAERLVEWAKRSSGEGESTVMVASTAPAEEVRELQTRYGVGRVAEAIEVVFGMVCKRLVREAGFRRLVVAGGETSGAVVKELGVQALRIGTEICTGVPWTETEYALDGQNVKLALALKSGNFGDERFFESALDLLDE